MTTPTQPSFLIVGAGTAGCVLAQRLAAAGERCQVLEAGGDDKHPFVSMPAAFAKLFKSRRDWAFETTPQGALDGRPIFWPRGKMLGGSSSMNAQIHQWCDPEDFKAWEAAGASGWGATQMAEALRSVEAWTGAPAPGRGADGVPVTSLAEPHSLSHDFVASARQVLGACGPSYNPGGGAGAWVAEATHRNGARVNAATAFLKPAVSSGLVDVVTNARVLSIVFKDRRAVGVRLLRAGREETVYASRGVIVAAGAVMTPHLLMHSGIGPEAHLRSKGVQVVADAPGVGANLQDHLMFVMHFRVRGGTLKSAESPANLVRYLLHRRGMLGSNVAEALAFFGTEAGIRPDIELVFAPVVYDREGLKPPRYHGVSIGVVLLTPKSRGRVALVSSDPLAAPAIDPAYLTDPDGDDLRRIVHGVRIARTIAAAAPLQGRLVAETRPGVGDEGALVAAIRAHAHTIYHPVASCRLGADADAPVSPDCSVKGVDGLWAADASLMPIIPRGHPNAVVMAIAHKASAHILAARA